MMLGYDLTGYRIVLTLAAQKGLGKIDRRDAVTIWNKLNSLVSGAQNLDVKKIVASKYPTYRLRVGCYRVLYEIYAREVIVQVIRVVHRKDAYI